MAVRSGNRAAIARVSGIVQELQLDLANRFELRRKDGSFVYSVLHENLEKRVIYAGLAVLSNLTAAVAVAVGMWEPASFAGFQAPRAGRTAVAEVASFRPRSAISTARPPDYRPLWRESAVWAAGGAKITAFQKAA